MVNNFAGTGILGFTKEKTAATAADIYPNYIFGDSTGTMFVGMNNRIVKIDSVSPFNVSTVVGMKFLGTDPDRNNVAATSTIIGSIQGLWIDSLGNMFYIDRTHLIRKVVINTNIVTTVVGILGCDTVFAPDDTAGTSACIVNSYSLFGDTVGNIYYTEQKFPRIRIYYGATTQKIATFAGTGTDSYSGDGGPAISATISICVGLFVTTPGDIYFVDKGNQRIRKILKSTGIITTIAGTGTAGSNGNNLPATSTQIISPQTLWINSQGTIYYNDDQIYILRKITNGIVTTIAGSSYGFSGDGGPATSAQLKFGYSLWGDSIGNIFFADALSFRIRKINAAQIISTYAGTGTFTDRNLGGPASQAQLSGPLQVWADSIGNVFIGDLGFWNCKLKKVNPQGIITVLAGMGDYGNSPDNTALSAAAIYVFQGIWGDTQGNIYFAQGGGIQSIRKISTTNILTTVAGFPGGSAADNIPLTSASLGGGYIASLFGDTANNLFFFLQPQNVIRKANLATSIISTFAGQASVSTFIDNVPASQATFNTAFGIWIDPSYDMFIADHLNHRLRRIKNGIVTTFAGNNAPCSGYNAGPVLPTSTSLCYPYAVVGDTNGNIFIADTGFERVRLIYRYNSTMNYMKAIAGVGIGLATYSNGPQWAPMAGFKPYAMTLDRNNVLYAVDVFSGSVKKIFAIDSPTGQPSSQPSRQPSVQPTRQPSCQPTSQPSKRPTCQPTSRPSTQPSIQPTGRPSSQPSVQPSTRPSVQPSSKPTCQPTSQPSRQPSCQPTSQPSKRPTCQPTSRPTTQPSIQPTGRPSSQPSVQPSTRPSVQPSSKPTCQPTSQPSRQPISLPSSQPSSSPSRQPSSQPSRKPSSQPSCKPSNQPTSQPSAQPVGVPSSQPSSKPSCQPTSRPTSQPVGKPSNRPSSQPSSVPSDQPSSRPSSRPVSCPSTQPSSQPSRKPSTQPITLPTGQPSSRPSIQPFSAPTSLPSCLPTSRPSNQPSMIPTQQPLTFPSSLPTGQPSLGPTTQPTCQPSNNPSTNPSLLPSGLPSAQPSVVPTLRPSEQPSSRPSDQPTSNPSTFTRRPTSHPTSNPKASPSTFPSSAPSSQPGSAPSTVPSGCPSMKPSSQPSLVPSALPSYQPTSHPTLTPSTQPIILPTSQPSSGPSVYPTIPPSTHPTRIPTSSPSVAPTRLPSSQPTSCPTTIPSNHPTVVSSSRPTSIPSICPSVLPSPQPSGAPTVTPAAVPTVFPTSQPSETPSITPTTLPIGFPTLQPTLLPFSTPTVAPSSFPVALPSGQPSREPSAQPVSIPTCEPTSQPTVCPSRVPTKQPSSVPSSHQTTKPLFLARPTVFPTVLPTVRPTSSIPSRYPSISPSIRSSRTPTSRPTGSPSLSQPSFYNSFPPALSSSVFSIISSNTSTFLGGKLFLLGRMLPETATANSIINLQSNVLPEATSFIIFGEEGKKLPSINLNDPGRTSFSAQITQSLLSQDGSTSRSIGIVGDINQDGIKDIIVGYPVSSYCVVYLRREISNYLNMKVSSIIYGRGDGDYFGWAIASAEDFNHDGIDDFMISSLNAGIVYIIYGRRNFPKTVFVSDLTRSTGMTIIGESSLLLVRNTGMSLSSAGDFNHDGHPDLLVSATLPHAESILYIVFGKDSPLPATLYLNQTRTTTQSSSLNILRIIFPVRYFAGFSLSSLGDIDRDGYDDIIVGSLPYQGGYGQQRSYVLYGRSINFELAKEYYYLSELKPGEEVTVITGGGFQVAGAGDVNEDGCPDILVVNYPDWRNNYQGNNYLLSIPRNVSASPTMLPTSFPSSSPRALPTSVPSQRIVSSFPTNSPSRAEIDTLPPSSSVQTTFPPNLSKTGSPTVGPKTVRPTKLPSFSPTTRSPTRKPTYSPSHSPSVKPSTIAPSKAPISSRPSQHPTFSPTKFVFPTSFPSSYPTIAVATPYKLTELTVSGNYTLKTGLKEEIVITGSGEVLILAEGNGRLGKKIYKIVPSQNQKITISQFQLDSDVIDFSSFPQIKSERGILYTTNPLVFHLSSDQTVIFSSLDYFSLTEKNFIFSSDSSDRKDKSNVLDSSVIIPLVILLTGVGFMIFVLRLPGCNKRSAKTKDPVEQFMKLTADMRVSNAVENGSFEVEHQNSKEKDASLGSDWDLSSVDDSSCSSNKENPQDNGADDNNNSKNSLLLNVSSWILSSKANSVGSEENDNKSNKESTVGAVSRIFRERVLLIEDEEEEFELSSNSSDEP
jgi:hypothetical protein